MPAARTPSPCSSRTTYRMRTARGPLPGACSSWGILGRVTSCYSCPREIRATRRNHGGGGRHGPCSTRARMWTLARKLLLHDRLRFAAAIAGVSVSVTLVLVQVGLYFGFMNTASSIIDESHADLWVGKAGNESFEFASPFDERAFYKVASVPGVERTERVLMNFAQFKVANGGDLGVQVVGIETTPGFAPMLAPWNVIDGDANRLREAGAIVVDKTEYKKLGINMVGHVTEVTGVRSHVVALTQGIRSFTTSPIVFTDIRTARSFMPGLGTNAVTYILVK